MKKKSENYANSATQEPKYPRLRVKDVAAELRLSPRQVARLAKQGIPGVVKAPTGYTYHWFDCPETRDWIEERKRYRKGNRKHPKKRKPRLSTAQGLVQAIRSVEQKVTEHFQQLSGVPADSDLIRIRNATYQIATFAGHIHRALDEIEESEHSSGD